MALVVLLQASPRVPATGATQAVRLAGGGSKGYTQLTFSDWRSGVATAPRFSASIGFDQDGWNGASTPQTAAFRVMPSDKALYTTLANLFWSKADLTVTTGDDELAVPVYTAALVGTVADVKASDGALSITLADLSANLDKPVAPDTFAGTGDLEGVAAAKGRVKRRTWGKVFGVEGRLLDNAYNVYEFGDPTKPLNAFTAVKDKGRAGPLSVVAWAGTAAATLTALRAVKPPDGGAAVAPSIGCAKWWTIPAGPLTADFEGEIGVGYVDEPANLAARVLSLYAPTIALTNLATALTWQGGEAGVHVDSSSETIAQVLDRILLPVRTLWLLDPAGTVTFRLFTWAGPVETIKADTIAREAVFQPLKTRKLGYQRNHRVHSDGEISAALLASSDNLIPDPASPDTWQLTGGAVAPGGIGLARPAEVHPVSLPALNARVTWTQAGAIRVNPGDKLWLGFAAKGNAAGGADFVIGGIRFVLADGTTSDVDLSATTATGTDSNAAWVYRVGSTIAPAGTQFAEPYTYRGAFSAGGFYVGEPNLSRHEPGADVTAGSQVTVSVAPNLSLPADYTGDATAALPVYITPEVKRGAADIRAENGTSYAITNTGLTATIENTNGDPDKGIIEVTAAASNTGYIDMVVTVDGIAQPTIRITVTKAIAAPPALGGSGSKIVSDSTFLTINSTSYIAISDVMTLTLASGESFYATAPLDYHATGGLGVTRTPTLKWQHSPTGAGTWTDFAAGISGSATTARFGLDDPVEPGHGDFNQTKGGLSAGDYDVRLMGLIDGTGGVAIDSGTATVEAKV